mgnify:CR=1 FL=1
MRTHIPARTWFVLVLLAMALSMVGCNRPLELTDVDEGRQAVLEVGDRAIIKRESNPTTGYCWEVLGLDDQDVITLVTRRPIGLERDGGWGDTTITLPEGIWTDRFTGNAWSGTVTVAGGTLVLDGTAGSLGASCTNVVVDVGTLTVRNSSAIANRADLSIAAGGGAKVELAAGVNEAVAHLYLDGEMRRVGTYGSTSSAATYKNDEFFSGTGVLTVLYDVSGTLIKVR